MEGTGGPTNDQPNPQPPSPTGLGDSVSPRTLIDDPRCGSVNGYNNLKCRCARCRSAWSAHQKELRTARRPRLEADPHLVPHGRPSTYGNWGCRCIYCTAAWTASTNHKLSPEAKAHRLRQARWAAEAVA